MQSPAEAGAELEHARSTTPTSSAQFALAAGIVNMNAGVGASRIVAPRDDTSPAFVDGMGSLTERIRGLELDGGGGGN